MGCSFFYSTLCFLCFFSISVSCNHVLDPVVLAELKKQSAKYHLKTDIFDWICSLPAIEISEISVERYAQTSSSQNFDSRNKRNLMNVNSLQNVIKIREWISQNLEFLLEVEAKTKVDYKLLCSLFMAESRMGTANVKTHKAWQVFLSQLKKFPEKIREPPRKQRLIHMAAASLCAMLAYAEKNNFPPENLDSTWAGAMGPMQFMPFNYRYLQDGDGDGKASFESTFDSILAAGYFLKEKGWTSEMNESLSRKEVNSTMEGILRRYNANTFYVQGVFELAIRLR